MGGLDVLPGGALVGVRQGGIDLGPDEAHLLGHVDQVVNLIQDATPFLKLFMIGFKVICLFASF